MPPVDDFLNNFIKKNLICSPEELLGLIGSSFLNGGYSVERIVGIALTLEYPIYSNDIEEKTISISEKKLFISEDVYYIQYKDWVLVKGEIMNEQSLYDLVGIDKSDPQEEEVIFEKEVEVVEIPQDMPSSYEEITLEGLKQFRPDLFSLVAKKRKSKSRATPKHRFIELFNRYLKHIAEGKEMTKQRCTSLGTFYSNYLRVDHLFTGTPEFTYNNETFYLVWHGEGVSVPEEVQFLFEGVVHGGSDV